MIYLESGKAIHYHDVRKFGTFTYLPTNDWKAISAYPMLGKLGKDANAEWEEDELYYLIHDKTPVKAVLLDQTVIAGLGNIYVNEVCYLAKVHPLRLASSISKEEANKISFFCQKVLTKRLNTAEPRFVPIPAVWVLRDAFNSFSMFTAKKAKNARNAAPKSSS